MISRAARLRTLVALAAAVTMGCLAFADPVTAGVRTPVDHPDGGTLEVAIPGPFGGCDPASPSTTDATDAVLSLVLPSAFTNGPMSEPVGDTTVVAQAEIVNLSPQRVVYTIAPNVTWPDGSAFSAADFVRTWHERRSDHVVRDLGYREIASVVGGPTLGSVTVTFTQPYADWESLFSNVTEAGSATAGCTMPSAAADPSIGPYSVASATSSAITLVVDSHWSGAVPAYGKVVFLSDPAKPPTPDGDPRATLLDAPSLPTLEAVTSTGLYSSLLQASTSVVSLDFAVTGPHALSSPIRGALAHLIDRRALLDALATPVDFTATPGASHLVGQGETGYLGVPGVPVAQQQPVVPVVPGSTGADAYGAGSDLAASFTTLGASGYRRRDGTWVSPSGQPLTVCLATPKSPTGLAAVADELASQLTRSGVRIVVTSVPGVVAGTALLRTGACTAAVVERTGDGFVSHEANPWLAPVRPLVAWSTWTGVDDRVVRVDAAAASATLNPIQAQPTWQAMDARLWNLMVGLPLYSPPLYEAWSPSIAGVLACNSVAGFVDQVPSLLPSTDKS